jgi:nitronate monooxygenase
VTWPTTKLTDLLGIEHPIIQAPMAGASTPALAAAVSNAGGLGSLGCAMQTADVFRSEIGTTRKATNRPIHVNFFAHEAPSPDAAKETRASELLAPYYEELGLGDVPPAVATHFPFDATMLEAVLAVRPQIVSFHFGLPDEELIRAIKDTGIILLCSATSVREAVDLEKRGVDAVIAQGWEAGGHRGTYLSSFEGARAGTMSLVPQVVDAVKLPVIAAGGIADGRGIAAAFALGASGVQMGTAFLTCEEAGIPDIHKEILLKSRDDDTRVTKAFSGRPARGIVNRYIEDMAAHEDELPDFPLVNTMTGPLRKASAARGKGDFVALWSGQSVGLNRALPAGELFEKLVEEAQSVFQHGIK